MRITKDVRKLFAAFGRKGGAARAAALSPARRKEIAAKAGRARWAKAAKPAA